MHSRHPCHGAALLIALGMMIGGAGLAATPQKTEAQLRSLREKIEKITQQVSRDALQRDRLSADLRAAELGPQRATLRTQHRPGAAAARPQ
jgi:hypothetical protein